MKRNELLLEAASLGISIPTNAKIVEIVNLIQKHKSEQTIQIKRLNYIGSKFQLLDWLLDCIKKQTGLQDFNGVHFGDLFAGTGIVSYKLRKEGAIVLSNDAELYSSCITQAFNTGIYTNKIETIIAELNSLLDEKDWDSAKLGYIATNYSPNEKCERMFFTPSNAKKIDFIRNYLDMNRHKYTDDEFNFLLASLIVSADAVSNVAAVYGCYLKKFKATSQKQITLIPIHTDRTPSKSGCRTTNLPVEQLCYETDEKLTVAYIDPPYNERQYSKNYFPLNQIAKCPETLRNESSLTGKTGIPVNCYTSPFCRKKTALCAFEDLVKKINSEWVFISYNTEGIVSKDDFIKMLNKYGKVDVLEKTYKRFKSYKYNEDKDIKELLFCLHKTK